MNMPATSPRTGLAADAAPPGKNRRPVTLSVSGMSCASCVNRVESTLAGLPGVHDVAVNLALESARLEVDQAVTEQRLLDALEAAGYPSRVQARTSADHPEEAEQPDDGGFWWLIFAAVLSTPLVLPMLGMALGASWRLPPVFELALAAPVQFLAGARFYRGAWQSLRHASANMDVLVALGTSAAFGYSLAVVAGVTRGHLYFEASAVIITLVLLGKWLEARARRGAGESLRQLMALRPDSASVERDGVESRVPAEEVQPGDTVVVRPGERIPVDGVVLEGESELDESLLTGESIPVHRRPGDTVTGGAINGDGALRLRCTAGSDNGRLARIVSLVEDAQMRKAPVQRLVDRVAGVFVPVVIAIAAMTFAAWWLAGGGFEQALVCAVAVLVIACPCALGLATPTALVAGTGAAARAGILIRDAQALELAATVSQVVFDKTGTLTRGQPRVVTIRTDGLDEGRVLTLAASLQERSEHPLARALVAHARQQGLAFETVTDFRNHPGAGVSGQVGQHSVAIGNVTLMTHLGVTADGIEPDTSQDDGLTWSLVAVDDHRVGAVAFADALREESAAAVAALRRRGLAVSLLTGDNEGTARRVARESGIDDWTAGATPEDKQALVRDLADRGARVAMVGDGVNDAPALAAAHLGIAMGEGTDVAMETAGITVMRSDPRLVAGALAVSRATLHTIRQNLFWAFIYNVVGIPVAALGFLNPAVAGAAMALSSVCVVTNSLRLRHWRHALISGG
jgi:Cu+-exporting ATPase